jgi:hypothetical protein
MEPRNEMMTWKCLRKLCPDELQETVDMIQAGEVDFRQKGWEDVYPTNEEVLDFARGVEGVVVKTTTNKH